jgi:hypothetical protein
MRPDLNRIIEKVAESGVEKAVVIQAIEEMMLLAARRTLGEGRKLECRFNNALGIIEVFDGNTKLDAETTERISAYAACLNLLQHIRAASRQLN